MGEARRMSRDRKRDGTGHRVVVVLACRSRPTISSSTCQPGRWRTPSCCSRLYAHWRWWKRVLVPEQPTDPQAERWRLRLAPVKGWCPPLPRLARTPQRSRLPSTSSPWPTSLPMYHPPRRELPRRPPRRLPMQIEPRLKLRGLLPSSNRSRRQQRPPPPQKCRRPWGVAIQKTSA